MEALPVGYLILSRMEGERIHLSIDSDADPAAVLEQLRSGIYIDVSQIKGGQVRLGIEAPPEVLVMRSELVK